MNNRTSMDIIGLSETQKISCVKKILEVISKCTFAYDELQQTINFDMASVGLSSSDVDDIIEVCSNFPNFKGTTSFLYEEKSLSILLENCYSSIVRLKNVPKHGEVYYNIIMRYYIKKEFRNADEAAEKICADYTRQTFFRRSNAACKELYHIWFCVMPRNNIEILNEIINSL